jgi:Phosphotransferase enzyme family
MGRAVRLVLVSPAGQLLGMLPVFELACPFWPESADVVAEAEGRFKAGVVVLRLLDSDGCCGAGGAVSYLAELQSAGSELTLLPVSEALRERAERQDALRMPWAERGGPGESLAWARAVLAAAGQTVDTAVQQRTWNLSTLWRLEAAAGGAKRRLWLKQVPRFMKHESRVLRWLNGSVPGAAPALVASDDFGRSLLEHVEGEDLYGAPVSTRRVILDRLHEVQCAAAHAVDELLALGVPDLRGARRADDCARKLVAWAPHYPGLAVLLRRLEQQLQQLQESGLPATLVHSDNHPGNARGSAELVTLLDWGESFIGHPVTDLMGLVDGLAPEDAGPLIEHWCGVWKDVAPGSTPERAVEAAPFIAAMHGAATYAHFLQHIEESERPYHAEDVPRCLAAAATLAVVQG